MHERGMATIVLHRESGLRYVLLGTGLRSFTPQSPVPVAHDRQAGRTPQRPILITSVSVCNGEGEVLWFRSEEIVVVEIDGRSPAAALQPEAYR